MPNPSEILGGLAAISSEMRILAIVWHIVIGIWIVALVSGWRPTRRLAAIALVLPLISVGVLAWMYRNPFNGVVFLLAALGLAVMGSGLPKAMVEIGACWNMAIGGLLVLFGWVYPHFLAGGSWLKYLYASPVGLIPCPTLCVVAGFALIFKGFEARAWSILLAALGVFYALFGAFRLGVWIDIVLLAGAGALFFHALKYRPAHSL
jgi:hypothetical protein